jgi:hypothetical protein
VGFGHNKSKIRDLQMQASFWCDIFVTNLGGRLLVMRHNGTAATRRGSVQTRGNDKVYGLN